MVLYSMDIIANNWTHPVISPGEAKTEDQTSICSTDTLPFRSEDLKPLILIIKDNMHMQIMNQECACKNLNTGNGISYCS